VAFKVFREGNKRHLAQYAKEGPKLHCAKRHTQYVLVEECRDEESQKRSNPLIGLPCKERAVDMSLDPVVNGKVPGPPIVTESFRVPPIIIKSTVPKASNLRNDIQVNFKEAEESKKPHVKIWNSCLKDSFGDSGIVLLVQVNNGILNRGVNVLMSNYIGKNTEQHEKSNTLTEFFSN